MGTIYWLVFENYPILINQLCRQLNDIWPGMSWSSLEYSGRWKILHYFARKFYAPLLISAFENDGKIKIFATSDLQQIIAGKLDITLWTWKGEEVSKWSLNITISALESRSVL